MRLRELRILSYWHGSDTAGLTELKPKDSDLVGKKVVFAATHPEVAVAMAHHWSDRDFDFGRSMGLDDDPDDVPYIMRERRPGAFKEFFTEPVHLYEVASRGFHTDRHIQDFEMVCDHEVKISDEKLVDDPLKYLKHSRMVQPKMYHDREGEQEHE